MLRLRWHQEAKVRGLNGAGITDAESKIRSVCQCQTPQGASPRPELSPQGLTAAAVLLL